MKKYIYKINQYLLENYPTIWNTKIVWMLLVSFVIHLFFFVIGYFTFTSLELLQESNAKDIFFENGTIFFSVILSILILVVWLVYLFKNNSFKNFYPTSRLKLFSQFICYLIIIFFSTTFYFSYNLGFKRYISNTYIDEVVKDEIKTANDAALFFSHAIDNYTIDNLKYPQFFSDIYCEKNKEKINYDTLHVSWLDYDYQFYTLEAKDENLSNNSVKSTYDDYIYYKRKDSITTFFFKDSVVDILKYKESVVPTYYNFSNPFYISGSYYNIYPRHNSYELQAYKYDSEYQKDAKIRAAKSKQVQELLIRNNPNEIKVLLQKLLSIADKYSVNHNLTATEWFTLVYHPEKFTLKSLIRKDPKDSYDYGVSATAEQTKIEKFRQEHLTDFFIQTDNLKYVFENIEQIKETNVFMGNIHIFIWLSFSIAMLIFIFRITGIRSFIFTIVTAGLLAVFISLVAVLYSFLNRGGYDAYEEYFILYFILFVGSTILFSSLFLIDKVRKSIIAVFMNVSLVGFVLYLLLIVLIISLHQRDACGYDDNCFVLIEKLGANLSYILFVIGLVFVYFYSSIIKRWKGLPEG